MSDYSNTFGGAAKDTAGSTIIAAEHDTEYDALATHIATKTNKIAAATNNNLVTMDASGDIKDSGTDLTALAVGSVTATGNASITGDIILPEKANHSSTPSAGNGYIWVRNDAPSSLIYTDDDGIDHRLTAEISSKVTTTSGTRQEITSIPSWVKKVTLSLSGVSMNSSHTLIVELGTSGSFKTSGYTSTASSGTSSRAFTTSGFVLNVANADTAFTSGLLILTLADEATDTWVVSSNMNVGTAGPVVVGAGKVALGGTLTRLGLDTTTGTAVFDAGFISATYE